MAFHWCASISLVSLILLSSGTFEAAAQATYIYGTFSGAIYVSAPAYTQAVQAQCPADHPQRCDAVQQPNYCCAAGYYCGMAAGNVVGCCANGQTCSGAVGGQPMWTPVVVTVTSYYTGNGGAVVAGGYYTSTTAVYGTPATTPPYVVASPTHGNTNGGYCSTLTANGPGLPTVRQGGCGQILVVSGATSSRISWSAATLAALLCGILIA